MEAGREIEGGQYYVSQTQENCFREIQFVIAAAAAEMPNKLPGFLVWINVMTQCLFCLQTNLDTICGPFHTLQCSASALVTHSLASPPLPFYYPQCHVSQHVWGSWAAAPRRNEGEDFKLTADSFCIGLTRRYNWVNDTVDVAIPRRAAAWIQAIFSLPRSQSERVNWKSHLWSQWLSLREVVCSLGERWLCTGTFRNVTFLFSLGEIPASG